MNFFSAISVIFGGIFGFFLSEKIGENIVFLLPLAAGNFIYIACSDLIPEIKEKIGFRRAFWHFFIFLMGLGSMLLMRLLVD